MTDPVVVVLWIGGCVLAYIVGVMVGGAPKWQPRGQARRPEGSDHE